MDGEFPLLASQYESEDKVTAASAVALGESLSYFQYLQETTLMALNNGGSPFIVRKTTNNPILFALITTTRAFSIAKAAMDQLLRGQPQVGMALSRFLSEISQSTQYLVRHPNLIDGYLEGHANLERILRLARQEKVKMPDAFSRFWGLQSRYSHAGREFLGVGVETDGNSMRSKLLIFDKEILHSVFYGILGGLFTQYMIFRMVIKGMTAIENQLIARDGVIFHPESIRQHLGLEMLDDDFIEEFHDFFRS